MANSKWVRDTSERARKVFRGALTKIGYEISSDLRTQVGKRVGMPGRIRSLPGESPRRDKSVLYNSFRFKTYPNAGKNKDMVIVTSNDPKAPTLENGGPTGTGYIEARPFFAPVRKRWKGKTKQRLQELMNERM